ncbi:uncharacterized protein V1516DRAFT_676579 [Lipomyces oligophaga]|uniref:uncharacterized protein n=1 Tax=Lipomyces oligophaga TaxID=45792 RepID=UPI0034CDD8DE
MGKSKKISRNSAVRVSALRNIRSSKLRNRQTAVEAANSDNAMPLLKKLASPSQTDRAMAARAIATLIENAKVREMLLKEKLVHTLLKQSITDSSEEVVAEAFGVLRNLALEEGYDVCKFLWRENILISIEKYLVQIDQSLSALESLTNGQRTLLFTLAENILSLLLSLGTVSDDIRNSITQRFPELPEFDLRVIKNLECPESLRVVAADNLYGLTEDNEVYISVLQKSDFHVHNSLPIPVQIYISGVQFNILEFDPTAGIDILNIAASIQESFNSINIDDCICQLEQNEEGEKNTEKKEDSRISAQNSLAAVCVGLELITAISESVAFSKFGSQLQKSDKSDGIDVLSDEEGEEDLDEMQGLVAGDKDGEIDDFSRDPVQQMFVQNIFPKITSYLSYTFLKSHAFNALNNLCWTLNATSNTSELWSKKAQEAFPWFVSFLMDTNHLEIESVTACMGILWALASQLKGDGLLTYADVQNLITKVNEVSGKPDYIEYQVRAIGFLGVLAQQEGRTDVTKSISIFLVTQILSLPNKEPQIVIEALNSIFDIFADQDYDYDRVVFVKGGLLKHLVECQAEVRKMVKRIDKRKESELRLKADEVMVNLQRFCVYKSKEQKK